MAIQNLWIREHVMQAMSPDMAGFGLVFQNDANDFGIMCYMRIDWKSENRPVRGPGLQKSTSERDWGLAPVVFS